MKRGRGNAYVNSNCVDMMAGEECAAGIIAMVAPDGSFRQVADGLEFPNGMAVTPDNSILIVAECYAQRLTAFAIAANGDLSNRRVGAEVDGHPDGICLDADNAVWCAAMLRCLRIAEGGEVLQTIEPDRCCFACMLGGPEQRTLFMMGGRRERPRRNDGRGENRSGAHRARSHPSSRLAVRPVPSAWAADHRSGGSTLSTVWTRSNDRSNEAILPTPVLSAQATR